MQKHDEQSHINTPSQPVSPVLSNNFRIVSEKRRTILLITAICTTASIVYAFMLPNVYTAKGLLVPAQEDKNSMTALMGQLGGLAGLAGTTVGGSSQADLFVTMLKSETIRDALIDRFNLMEVYKTRYRSQAYGILDKNSAIGAGKKDGVISIAVNDKDAKRAAELANAYMEELGKLAVSIGTSGAGSNRVFLEERLAKAKTDLASAEESLKQFQSQNKAINVSEQAKASIEGVAKLKAELVTQEIMLSTLRQRFTDSSQEVKTASTTVANLKTQIAKIEGKGTANSVPSFGAMPALGQEYLRLTREYKVQESLVELLTKQYELARFNEAKNVSPIQVIQKAKAPDRKSGPKRLLIVISSFIYSLFLSSLSTVCYYNFYIMRNKNKSIEK